MSARKLTRDDLVLSYGYTRNLLDCPACEAGPGFDADHELVGEDVRGLALADAVTGRRLCDPCAKVRVGEDILYLIDKIALVDIYLFALVDSGDLQYGSNLVKAGISMILDEVAGYGTKAVRQIAP